MIKVRGGSVSFLAPFRGGNTHYNLHHTSCLCTATVALQGHSMCMNKCFRNK